MPPVVSTSGQILPVLIIFSDEFNNASMSEGIRACGTVNMSIAT